MCIGAVDFNGQHIFRTCISDLFTSYDLIDDYLYTEIIKVGTQILFVNTGLTESIGQIVAIDATNNLFSTFVKIDAGNNYLFHYALDVEEYNGKLYFGIMYDNYTSILDGVSNLSSNDYI